MAYKLSKNLEEGFLLQSCGDIEGDLMDLVDKYSSNKEKKIKQDFKRLFSQIKDFHAVPTIWSRGKSFLKGIIR